MDDQDPDGPVEPLPEKRVLPKILYANILRLVGGLLLAGAIAAALIRLSRGSGVALALEWIDSTGWLGPFLLAGCYVCKCVLMIPGTPISLAAGGLFGVLVGTVTIWVGATAGSSAAFLLGRSLLRARVDRWLGRTRRLRALDRAVGREGFKVVLLCRISPFFPFVVLNYAFALTGVRFRDYVLATAIGMLPATFLFVYLGAVARGLAVGDLHSSRLLLTVGLAATVAVTIVLTRIATRMLRESVSDQSP